MPLDPSIPLAGAGQRSPLDVYAQMLSIRELSDLGRYRRDQRQEFQRQRELEEAQQQKEAEIDAILDKHTSVDAKGNLKRDDAAIKRELIASGYSAEAAQHEARQREREQAIKAMAREELQAKAKETEAIGKLFGAVFHAEPAGRPAAYRWAMSQAERRGMQIPEHYPPEYAEELFPGIKAAYYETLTVKQLIDLEASKRKKEPEKPKLTPSYNVFKQAWYPGWLEEKGLKPNAKLERQAWDEYREETKKQPRTPQLLTPEEEAQQVRLAHAKRPPKPAPNDEGLIQAVMDNPNIYDNLTATVKSRISSQLAARGFKAFGKPLSDAAIRKISESRAAIASLEDLRAVLLENEGFLGPIGGLAAMNPYSEARQAQADVDRVRQRAGKALEGGVLRKEDEEKYKRILAVLTDTPETAIYKVDQLMEDLERDIQIFRDEQRKAGRRVDPETKKSSRDDDEDIINRALGMSPP